MSDNRPYGNAPYRDLNFMNLPPMSIPPPTIVNEPRVTIQSQIQKPVAAAQSTTTSTTQSANAVVSDTEKVIEVFNQIIIINIQVKIIVFLGFLDNASITVD